ncbi:aspartic proteinase CDR1-like [Papaver somniferum]|uniref:aspartic proteinase CDR1-like n=1 Tax=Papaver somniferum TaxID=3469 RepID=UPI000E6F7580|nr:aspartic proteinase CDR1-like [Papaver somniferum]
MGKTTPTLFIFLLTIVTHVSLLFNSVIAVNPKGFTLRMVHKDSEDSPLYDPAEIHLMTPEERFQKLIDQSKARAHYIGSHILLNNNRTMNPDVVRMPLAREESGWYVGSVGIGTFPPDESPTFMTYSLMVDTGSDLTWLQCNGATQTFYQDAPLYPWDESQTYHPIPCLSHPYCTVDSCNINGECVYKVAYMSDAVTTCVIAKETFTMNSDTAGGGGLESFQLLMGCGFCQENFDSSFGNNHKIGKPDPIAGILGLARGPMSFLNQLADDGQGKFSYCLERSNKPNAGDTYISFGADATIGGGGQQVYETPIVVTPVHLQSSAYYLTLEDISVGLNPVGFARGEFELKYDGTGGCAIDTGSPFSIMYKDHFDRVAKLVMAHFQQFGIPVAAPTGDGLCFVIPKGEFTVPIITFHFQSQADFVVSETGFVQIGENVCLAISRSEFKTPAFILGAMQQVNKRILHDNMNMRFSFADEIC